MEPFPAGVGELFHDRAGNLRDVDLTLRKAWHMYREHIDPIIEIGPECTFIDTRLDVLVRGADQSEVDLDFIIAAHPLNLAVFKNAQELGLQWQRHVTDFVNDSSEPPLASSTRPSRGLSAPVNAPFSWPKISDSSNSAGMAAQFTDTSLPRRPDAS